MQIFYTPDIESNSVLPEEESAHAIRVLRLKEGNEILLTDGKGFFYQAIIEKSHPKHCEIKITGKHEQLPLWGFDLHIAIAPTKNIDRMEWFVEKSTEIGINSITCLECSNSERREIKLNRLEKKMISAMKQSLKASVPHIQGMINFPSFVEIPFEGQKFIAHCELHKKVLLKDIYLPGTNALILIGPEGDFSKDEIELAKSNGFIPVSLGESRLRTETAALVACNTIHVMN